MKHFIILLFITVNTFAQSDSISRQNLSVVSAEKVNIVYRGINNPIKIAVPGAKWFTAMAPGLQKIDDNGNYILNAGEGKEVIVSIDAVMQDDTVKHEEKVFRIFGLSRPAARINDIANLGNEIPMTKEGFYKAIITIDRQNFLFDMGNYLDVTSFTLILPNKKRIEIKGKTMNAAAIDNIKKLKKNSVLIIMSIHYGDLLACFNSTGPIAVKLID